MLITIIFAESELGKRHRKRFGEVDKKDKKIENLF